MDDLLELPSLVHPSVVPPLAMPCSLHGIESVNEGGGWSPLDLQLVWKHLYHKKACTDGCYMCNSTTIFIFLFKKKHAGP